MTTQEALEVIEEFGIDFEISDSSFGDGSTVISHNRLFNSESEAKRYIKAMEVLTKVIQGEI